MSQPLRPPPAAPRRIVPPGGGIPAIALLAITLAMGVVAPAGAQPRRDSVRTVEPVVITGARTAATIGGAGAVVVRPDSLPIPLQPAPTLDQVLRQTPFVLVRQNARGEVEVSERGSDSRQGAVLLDGLPLTLGWDHRTDASLIPATAIQRMTLMRGLSSLLTGPNALGGVIALDVNTPARAAAGGRGGWEPELHVGTGVD